MRILLFIGLTPTWLLCAAGAAAEDGKTRLAAYESLPVVQAARQVSFAKRPAEVGDRVEQKLQVSLELHSTVRHGQETIETKTTTLSRQQDRAIIAREIVDGRTVGAEVQFNDYKRTTDDKTELPPVVGNSYQCRRMEDDSLDISRADGSFASPIEFDLVSESMQSLGRSNPLADFLDGRTVQVGQSLEVPQKVGDALLSTDGALGSVSKFVVTLRNIDAQTGAAQFDVQMESMGAKTTQMRLMLSGSLDVDPATGRTLNLTLSGPLGMATTIGSYSAAETTFVRGKIKMQMAASYKQ